MNVRVDRQCMMYTVDRYQLHTENTHLATKHCGNSLGVVLRTQLNDHKTLKGLRRRLYCYYNRRQIGVSQKGSLHTPCFKPLQRGCEGREKLIPEHSSYSGDSSTDRMSSTFT